MQRPSHAQFRPSMLLAHILTFLQSSVSECIPFCFHIKLDILAQYLTSGNGNHGSISGDPLYFDDTLKLVMGVDDYITLAPVLGRPVQPQ